MISVIFLARLSAQTCLGEEEEEEATGQHTCE